jgi:flagellar assembly factor FliW
VRLNEPAEMSHTVGSEMSHTVGSEMSHTVGSEMSHTVGSEIGQAVGTASATSCAPSATVTPTAAFEAGLQPEQGGAPVDGELPDLVFVRPLPGFPQLTRFVLVRLDGQDAAAASTASGPGPRGGVADREDADRGASGERETEYGSGDREPGDREALLYELRSLERPEIRFLVAVPAPFFPDYLIELDEAACTELDLHDARDALVLVVLTVDPEAGGATANLLAPVVVNARTRQAAQVILSGSDWPVRAAVA